ncbi:MAG TPA: aminoglycoside phosphotransferase family protein, partial [Polyangiaceae bacterium]|nr:aminoglycoside phosphotransferase family protein [Polyangiaceae bacterium]
MSALETARAHWAPLRDGTAAPIASGLINETHLVEAAAGRFILQRLHPVFDPAMHHNIIAVTEHLAEMGMVTPRLVPTDDGAPFVDLGDHGVWRVLTHVPGHTFDAAQSPEQLASAAELVGRFHAAVDDLDHVFVGLRVGVHDTPKHLATLREALAEHEPHRLYPAVRPLADTVLTAFEELGPLPALTPRICHGDLKLSNVMFAGSTPPLSSQAICLIDLDTLAPMALAHELGDAWRSWCNPNREDDDDARFDLALFEASWKGYVAGYGQPPSPEARHALLLGVEHIILELTARFLADALQESYFGWDAERFAT